jgi:hypothetical protein
MNISRLFAIVLAGTVAVAGCPLLHAEDAPKTKPPLGAAPGAKPFKNKWYFVYLVPCGWKTARDRCWQAGGQLAIIPDEDTNKFIHELAGDHLVWIGATDEKNPGRWIWSDGSEMKYTKWLPSEPSNTGGKEHWLQMYGLGAWNDSAENDKRVVGYVCEWKSK